MLISSFVPSYQMNVRNTTLVTSEQSVIHCESVAKLNPNGQMGTQQAITLQEDLASVIFFLNCELMGFSFKVKC